MNRIGTLVVVGALLMVGSGIARAADKPPTFENCESAYNYASNTAKFIVSAAFNRVSCDLKTAEDNVDKSMRKLKIPPHNSDEDKACFYQGAYAGYVATLDDEFADCGYELDLGSVAQAAVSVFEAMTKAFGWVDGEKVSQVFDGVFDASGQDGDGCATYISANASGADGNVAELSDSVCWNQ